MAKNERNAGRKKKFPKGGEMVTFRAEVPKKALPVIREAYEKMLIDNQFKDYDWT